MRIKNFLNDGVRLLATVYNDPNYGFSRAMLNSFVICTQVKWETYSPIHSFVRSFIHTQPKPFSEWIDKSIIGYSLSTCVTVTVCVCDQKSIDIETNQNDEVEMLNWKIATIHNIYQCCCCCKKQKEEFCCIVENDKESSWVECSSYSMERMGKLRTAIIRKWNLIQKTHWRLKCEVVKNTRLNIWRVLSINRINTNRTSEFSNSSWAK